MNIFQINPYTITTNHFSKEHMRYCESITAVSNGHIGIRGNFEETYSGDSLQGAYIAGIWYPDKTKVGWWKNGYPEYYGKVINAVNFIGIKVFIEKEELDLAKQQVIAYSLQLDMRKALLTREATVQTKAGMVHIKSERILSANNKQICAIQYSITPLDRDANVTLIPYLDFNVANEDANYNELFWNCDHETVFQDGGYVEGTIKQNNFNNNQFRVGTAMCIKAFGECNKTVQSSRAGYVEQQMVFSATRGKAVGINKIVSVQTTSNLAEEIKDKTVQTAINAYAQGYDGLKQAHVRAFSKMMNDCDVQIDGDDSAQQGIRYNLFQLLSTYDGSNPKLNIGPKGMTGEKYGGAVYWDTEAFLIPFYLGIRGKEVAKNLLLFRHRTLEKAVENAGKLGMNGALYPMVTFDGHECHNEWEITFEEIHRSGAIAYAIYNYVSYTGDTDYLLDYGFDVLIQIARFWRDRVHYHSGKDVYMIHGVTGPNEYENNVNNNWYTNYIAKWCLEYTVSVAQQYIELSLGKYTDEELSQFEVIASKMYLPQEASRNIAVQHDTFLDKELKPAKALKDKERPIYQHWSWDKILRSCYIKQADVVQGMYFFDHQMERDFVKSNFEFYEAMTVHESSLSASIHSVVASRVGDREKAYALYLRTARLDLDNINNDTRDGLHITSMSGAWLAITQGFAGMTTITGELSLAPYLPKQMKKYAFKIHYRGRLLQVAVSKNSVDIIKIKGDNIVLYLYGQETALSERISVPLGE